MSKKVLWLSRHLMTAEQLEDLERIYGEIYIKQVSKSVSSAKEVLELGADCDVIAVVLPPALLADLTNPRINAAGKPVIRAVANRVPTGKTVVNPATGKPEEEFCFQHKAWEQVLKVEVITKVL